MKRHSGTWINKLTAGEILEKGKTLIGPFNELSTQDFENHVRKTYDIDYRRALDWMNTVRRFADKSELIAGLTEAVIRRLSSPSLDMADVEQIIADIRTGKIKSDYRSVEQAIRNLRAGNLNHGTSSTPNESLPRLDLEVLKRAVEAEKAEMERKLNFVQMEKERLKAEMAALEAEEQQMRTSINRFSKQLQGYALLIES